MSTPCGQIFDIFMHKEVLAPNEKQAVSVLSGSLAGGSVLLCIAAIAVISLGLNGVLRGRAFGFVATTLFATPCAFVALSTLIGTGLKMKGKTCSEKMYMTPGPLLLLALFASMIALPALTLSGTLSTRMACYSMFFTLITAGIFMIGVGYYTTTKEHNEATRRAPALNVEAKESEI